MTTMGAATTHGPAKFRDRLKRLREPFSHLHTLESHTYSEPLFSSSLVSPTAQSQNPLVLDTGLLTKLLPGAQGTRALDSLADTDLLNPTCLEDTCVDLQRQVATWVDEPHGKAIFWLTGPAGTGKSTVSRTVVQFLGAKGQLGATIFFRQQRRDCCNIYQFFIKVAVQLAAKVPDFAQGVETAIKADPTISEAPVDRQFDKLILQPLSQLNSASTTASILVLVIDALDECEEDWQIRTILRLLAKTKDTEPVCLRIFTTSRPELPNRLGFAKQSRAKNHDLILANIPIGTIEHDILIYLDHKFSKTRGQHLKRRPGKALPHYWPGEGIIKSLAKAVTPSFYAASTISRFVSDPSWDPYGRLYILLSYQTKSQMSPLDKTHRPILDQLLVGSNAEEIERLGTEFRETTGSIIILADVLSPISLAKLLDIPIEVLISRVEKLRSLLKLLTDENAVLRPWHLCFRDYLLDPRNNENNTFWVDEKSMHEQLARKCLQLLSRPNCLRENMCNLPSPGTLRSEIDSQTIISGLPAHVQYACRYLVYHLEQSKRQITDEEPIYAFIKEHLLHWIEALALMGEVREVILMINTLESILEVKPNEGSMMSDLLRDIKRFMLYFRSGINEAPLQIYSSAILFSPKKSIIRELYQKQIAGFIGRSPVVLENWTSDLQTLVGHGGPVNSVKFSPDGKKLVSASDDNAVRVWDAATGMALETLEGHRQAVNSAIFSPTGPQLVSVSADHSVRLWNEAEVDVAHSLAGHSEGVQSVAFSPDGKQIVSAAADFTIRIWDAETGVALRTITWESDNHEYCLVHITYSPDGKKIGFSSWYNGTVRVWDASTGAELPLFDISKDQYASVAFSPDSNQIASGSRDGVINLWDVNTGRNLYKLTHHHDFIMYGDGVVNVAFSPDGKMLASGLSARDSSSVKVWDLATRATIHVFKTDWGSNNSIAFYPDSKKLATAFYRSVVIYDIETGEKLFTLELNGNRVKLSPDVSQLAVARSEGIQLWDTASRKQLKTLTKDSDYSGKVSSMAFSPDGARLVSAAEDATIWVWDIGTAATLLRLEGHRNRVYSAAFSSDGKQVATTSSDQTVRLWDATTGEPLQIFKGHSGDVNSIIFYSNDTELVSASADKFIRQWDVKTGKSLQRLSGHSEAVLSLSLCPSSDILASASSDNTIKLWKIATKTTIRTLEGHRGSVNSVTFSPDGARLASSSKDERILLWDVDTGTTLHILEIGSLVKDVGFSPDGTQLAAALWNHTIRLWDAQALTPTYHGRPSIPVMSVMFSPNGEQLAAMMDDKTVRLLDAKTGAEIRAFKGHGGSVNSVAFSSDNKLLATTSDDETVKIWDLELGTVLHTLQGHESWVICAMFSPDNQSVASTSWDKMVRLWDVATGELLHILEGHSDWVSAAAFSSDGSLLASASDDQTVRLWDVSTGKALHTLMGHVDWVRAIAFSPDGRQLASASHDKTVRLWDVEKSAELRVFTVDVVARRISFSSDGNRLETDGGPLDIQLPAAPVPARPLVYVKGDWIFRETERLVWLPSEYIATCSALRSDNLLALGHRFGLVTFFEFNSSKGGK